MNRLRVKLYAPVIPASPVPQLAVRAARFLIEYCGRTAGVEATVAGGAADDAGIRLSWPSVRCDSLSAEQLTDDPTGAAAYASLLDDGSPPFDVLFMPHPWRSFPAGRLSANPAPLVAYVSDLNFEDVDLGSATDSHREIGRLLVRDCAAIVFASESLRQRMISGYGLPAERTAVVRPSASLPDSAAPADARTIVGDLGLPADYLVCFEAAGRSAEEALIQAHGPLPWPVVVLGDAPMPRQPGHQTKHSEAILDQIVRLPALSNEAYLAVLAQCRAVITFTSSDSPHFETHHLDAMALRKPLFCQAGADGANWEGGPTGLATLFSSVDELFEHLGRFREGQFDLARLSAAERHASCRTPSKQASELFDVFWSVHRAPFRERIRFRTAPAVCRERRVAWLCNHAALHAHEIPLIRSLGFEVYTPKQTPNRDFRSGAVAHVDDEFSTLPRWVLERLNRHNFYESALPADLIPILNSYFGTVIVSTFATMVRELAYHFRGRILVRAFGREHPANYHSYWNGHFGGELWDQIASIGHRFWLTPPYDSIGSFEPEPLRSLSLTLPLGIADHVMRNAGNWNGRHEKIVFVCPSINDSPFYYGGLYRDFKYHFGDFPHLIAGSQKTPVNDPHVLGYLPETAYRRLLNDHRVMFYHSREPRHLHYHPLEAIVQGMPVVYLKGGLMEEFGGPDQPGACDTEADARRKLRRILEGDRDLIEAIRNRQQVLLSTFLDEHVVREWKEKFVGEVMATPLTPGTRPPSVWMREPTKKAIHATTLPAPPPAGTAVTKLKIGVYLRTVRGGGVFNYVTTLVHRLTEAEEPNGQEFEVFLGRRLCETAFPGWPFDRHARLTVHHLADREFLPARLFPHDQPSRITVLDAPELNSARQLPERTEHHPRGRRQRIKARLKPVVEKVRSARTSHRIPAVRTGAAVLLALMCYLRGVVGQRTFFPQGTGARFILKHSVDPQPAPLNYQQICEIAARNEVTFFAYPFDSLAADMPLDEVRELPVVVVMYDLAHEFSGTWGGRNLTIHREMHVWARLARMIVFGSNSIRQEAVRRYGIPIEKTTVVTVPPLVARQEPPSAEETRHVGRRLGLPQNYVLNLGYQGPHKNNIVLLEAMALLKWRGGKVPPLVLAGPDARRFIVGDLNDVYPARIRNLIKTSGLVEGQDFFVLDYVAQEDIAGLYGGAAACVSVSQSEAQIHGMILEAMLYKRPLICSDIPCNLEQLGTDDECALVVPSDDPAAVADALSEILNKPDEAQARTEKAHQWIKGLTWEPVLEEYRRIFAIAAERKPEPANDKGEQDLVAA